MTAQVVRKFVGEAVVSRRAVPGRDGEHATARRIGVGVLGDSARIHIISNHGDQIGSILGTKGMDIVEDTVRRREHVVQGRAQTRLLIGRMTVGMDQLNLHVDSRHGHDIVGL